MSTVQAYRLSPEQARIWSLQQVSHQYRAQAAYALEGRIDIDAFQTAWQRVVDRFEILRTTFRRPQGMQLPLQAIAETSRPDWNRTDLSDCPPEKQEAELDRILDHARQLPFDFAQGPLLRLHLFALSPDRHILVVELPSVCADSRSIGILVDEAFAFYANGQDAWEASDEPLQYADYAEWHHDLLKETEADPGIAFWRRHRELALPMPNLAWRIAAAGDAPFEPGRLALDSRGIPVASVEAVAGAVGASVSDYFLACWHALLERLAKGPDVVVGAVPDDRGHESLLGAVGQFSTVLPIHFRFEDGTRFRELLSAVGRSRKAASDWQHYFSWDGTSASPAAAKPEFFPVAFEFNALPAPAAAAGISYTVRRRDALSHRFDLKLVCLENHGTVTAELHYDTSRLERDDVDRIARMYETLVHSTPHDPEALVRDLEILDGPERQRILVGFNDSRAEVAPRCVHELFEVHAERAPDAIAVVYEGQTLTYHQLNCRANELARQLRSRGVAPDVPAGLCVDRSLDMIVGILGILKAGGAYVPLDPVLPAQRISSLLADAKAPVLVTQRHLFEDPPESMAEVYYLDATGCMEDQSPVERAASRVTPANAAYVIFTSGSTGKPKGVIVEHRQLANYVAGVMQRLDIPAGASFATVSTFAADLGNTAIFAALCTGGALHVVSTDRISNPDACARYFSRHAVDCLKIVPSHLEALLQSSDPARILPLRRLILGGEASSWDLIRRLERLAPDCAIVNHYGPTEATIGVLAHPREPDGSEARSATLPLGRPLANSQVYLLDREMCPVPVGVPGELYIGGAGLARAYHGQPDQTAERFVAHPLSTTPGARLYRTGDQARYLPDGNIEFLGRNDDQVKIRGFRIELREIETALSQHGGVREAVVLARELTSGDRGLVAYLVSEGERGPTAGELRDFLKQQLPNYMIPAAFIMLKELPLTRNGKVDRAALPAPDAAPVGKERQSVPPRTRHEQTLMQIWCEVLGRKGFGVHDDFFELGGHSLLAMQLITRVREAFHVELPLPTLFDAPTVAGLAASIESETSAGEPGGAPALRSVSRTESLPLSFAQQRLWFLDQLEPHSAAYNRPFALRLQGPLNRIALEQALGEILRRHEVLRTTFPEVDGKAVQVIAPAATVSLPLVDVSHLSPSGLQAETQRLVVENAHKPFDLAAGPLVRACLLRASDDDHVLLVCHHHINTDAWSNEVHVREVSGLYGVFRDGRPSSLDELPVQYADYAIWQRAWLEGDSLQAQLAYWKEELQDVPTSLELPIDRPRAAVQTLRGDRRHFSLSRSQLDALKALGHEEDATLFMTLLAAFQALLYRYTGEPDILVGTPIAGRMQSEVQGLIGFFVNTLVLRADMRGNPRFRELLAQARRRAVAAYAHQDLPFEKLVDELEMERDLSRTPLFQVMFVLHTDAVESLALAELTLTPVEAEFQTSKFDLTLNALETDHGLKGFLEYNSDLFDGSTIERMLEHFGNLLAGMVADPLQRLSDLPLLNSTEQQLLLAQGNGTRVVPAQNRCLHELFEDQVERSPDSVALVFEGEHVTYRELNARSNQLAHYLRKRGVGPETLVGICVDRSVNMMVAVLGTLKAGGAYLPLDPAYPRHRLALILDDAESPVLLTEQRFVAGLPEHAVERVCLDTDWDAIAREAVENPACGTKPENLAYVIYTSGSTGTPKGTMISHRNVLRLMAATNHWFSFSNSDVWTLFHSYAFDFSVWEIWGALLYGGRLVVVPFDVSRSPEAFYRMLWREGVTVLNQTPSAFRQLMAEDGRQAADGASLPLRFVIFGGEALDIPSLKPWLDRHRSGSPHLINMYGITETTVHVTYHPIDELQCAARTVGSAIGQRIPDLEIHLLDRDLNLVPLGVAGEIHVGGSGLGRGYLNRPELTAERFVPDPFTQAPSGTRLYRSGDQARYLQQQNLEYLGRIDHQVKIRGFRIELGEIEAALAQYPDVREAVVVALEDQPGTHRLAAYVTCRSNVAPTVSDLRSHLNERLPSYMVPAVFTVLESLPLTPNGKLDRRALPAPDQTRPDLEEAFVVPRTPAERALAGIWSQVLGVERVGVHDNFFQLGGDSILSIQIVARASQAGLRVTPKDIFQHQTVAELAGVAGTASTIEAEQGPVVGPVPLTAIQHWFFEQHDIDVHHFNQAILLQSREVLDPERLEQAVNALYAHHDALRLRFRQEGAAWQQSGTMPSASIPVTTLDLSSLPETEQGPAMEETMARLQGSLNLSQGPLLRVAQFKLGADGPIRLFIVIHHLVVDGVSWRILLEDLETAYDQLSRGEAVRLPAKTTSFAHFSRRSTEYAASGDFQHDLDYWLAEPRTAVAGLPVDKPNGLNVAASGRSVSVSLAAAETQAMLREVPDAYRTQINDILLTAVVEAFAAWTGRASLRIDLEGHGREEIFEDVDLSRTVGWFTSLFPVSLEWNETEQQGESLKSIKEQLRAIPRRGIGYGLLRYLSGSPEDAERLRSRVPPAEVSFNYLGQLDQALPENSEFEWVPQSTGPAQSGSGRRSHLVDVRALIRDGRLQVSFQYSENIHRRETIDRLAQSFLDALRSLIRHCQSRDAGGYTPSDFPLADLDPHTLDQVAGTDREIEDIYPLAPTQQGLLFHTLFDPNLGVYFEQLRFTVQGPLNVPAFQQAWRQVVERHPVLRTSFRFQGLKKPLQVVHRHVPLPWEQQDWRGLSPSDRDRRLESFLESDRERGFDLSQAPLMRFALVRLAESSYQFVWSHHHILLDGWSLPLVLKEVLDCYHAFCRQEPIQLERPRPYREYIAWHAGQDLSAAEAFWRNHLRGFTAPSSLRIAAPRDVAPSAAARYKDQHVALSIPATEALRSWARSHLLTLNTLLQGAWALLLSRYSGEDDVVFGATVSGRSAPLPGVDSMVGLFINTVPVRVRVGGEESIVPWLQQLQTQQLEVRRYEYSPLGKVQAWSEVPAGTPMFESLLVVENYPVDEALRQPNAEPDIRKTKTIERTNYPLTIIADPGSQLSLRLVYDCNRFDQAAITRMAEHLEILLNGIASHRQLSELPMLSERERTRLLAEWNATRAAYPQDACIHELFEAQVNKTPDHVALVYQDERLSYRDLNRRANQLARHLRRLGVGPDVLVGVFVERSVEMVVALLGILKAGGAYVALDPSYPQQRLEFVLEDTNLAVLLTQQRLLDRLPDNGSQRVCLDSDWDRIARESQSDLGVEVSERNLSHVIYTSGSTGRPKGVAIEQRSVATLLHWSRQHYTDDDLDGVLLSTSICFDLSVWEMFVPLSWGGTVILAENALQLPHLPSARAVTLVNTVPSAIARLVQMRGLPSSVRRVNLAGEPLKTDLVKAVYDSGHVQSVCDLYGPSEDTTYSTFAERAADGPETIGRPIANTQVYLLSRSQPVPEGVVGELYLGGAGLARGYLHRPALTAECFVPDLVGLEPGSRLYRTGDLARYLPDGNLEFLGRSDYQVKIRGFRIELGEIETALARHVNVREAVVLAREDNDDDKRLVAYVVPGLEPGPSVSELRSFLKQSLPDYMVPSVYVPMPALARTPNGKVDRKALPEPEGSRPELDAAFVAARNDAEQRIAAVWQDALHVDQVGIDDNFFDVGGDSLAMIEVQWKLEKAFGRDIPLVEMFQNPTVRALADRFSRQHADTDVHKKSQTRAQARLAAVKQRARG